MSRPVRVTICYETDCLLLGHDHFMKVTNDVKTPKPLFEAGSECVEIPMLVRVTIW